MVINEKALLSNMKAAYGKNGYIVARRLDEATDEDNLVIQGDDWVAEITWENAPNKVLAMIVEHLKELPTYGRAFQAKKGEPNTAIFEMVDRIQAPSEPLRILLHRTSLMYGQMEVWQKTGNNGVVFVPLETADMLLDHGREVVWAKNGMILEGEASRVFVRQFLPSRTDSPESEAMRYLSGKAWC